MKILLTGGAGFIGSNLLKELNKHKHEVFVVDSMSPAKVKNISSCKMMDYSDKAFLTNYLGQKNWLKQFGCVIHLGATSSTTCADKSIIENNHEFSKELIGCAIEANVPVIYASSASVYGNTQNEQSFGSIAPLNMYALSKALTDNTIERAFNSNIPLPMIVGLRFFNVYGPGEAHKGPQASVIYNWHKNYKNQGYWYVFEGENKRDFIHVSDVIKVIIWFMKKSDPKKSGIYDVGTGNVHDFRDISDIVKRNVVPNGRSSREVELLQIIPNSLRDQYQKFTRADLAPLRDIGYNESFLDLQDGVSSYVNFLESEK